MTAPDEEDGQDDGGVRQFADGYRNTANPVGLGPRAEITTWFDGLTLLEPGITHLTDWRPDTDPRPDPSPGAA